MKLKALRTIELPGVGRIPKGASFTVPDDEAARHLNAGVAEVAQAGKPSERSEKRPGKKQEER